MVDDEGQQYERGPDGVYRLVDGLLGPKQAPVKRNILGQPVAIRDVFGTQRQAADGTPLYEAGASPSIPWPIAAGVIVILMAVALRPLFYPIASVIVVALAVLDLRARRMRYQTLLAIQLIVVIVAIIGGSTGGYDAFAYGLTMAAYAASGAGVGFVIVRRLDVPMWTLIVLPLLAVSWVLLIFGTRNIPIVYALVLLLILVGSAVGTFRLLSAQDAKASASTAPRHDP